MTKFEMQTKLTAISDTVTDLKNAHPLALKLMVADKLPAMLTDVTDLLYAIIDKLPEDRTNAQ